MTVPASFSLEAPPLPPPLLPAPHASSGHFWTSRCSFLFACTCCLIWVGGPNLTSESAKSPFASPSLHTALPGSESLGKNMKNSHSGLLDLSGLLRLCSYASRGRAPFRGRGHLHSPSKVVRRPIMVTTPPTRFPPSALALGAPGLTSRRHRRERWAVPPCVFVCMDLPLCAVVSQRM